MHQQPSAIELIEAVRAFLEDRALPELQGRTAFHARVAANALAIVARELALAPAAEADERERLSQLLGAEGNRAGADLDDLNREFCRRIRAGEIGLATAGLLDHLWRTTVAKMAIDQPKYEAYQRAVSI